jgi:hypothetical protein
LLSGRERETAGNREDKGKTMADELRGLDDPAASDHNIRDDSKTTTDRTRMVRVIVAALQADGRVTKPEEVARLVYRLQKSLRAR